PFLILIPCSLPRPDREWSPTLYRRPATGAPHLGLLPPRLPCCSPPFLLFRSSSRPSRPCRCSQHRRPLRPRHFSTTAPP
uniref:Uncharacterized protein n=1 Tax=Triticum urartu TaxID=4572 RepID=A0A8R7PDL1_TRIUA